MKINDELEEKIRRIVNRELLEEEEINRREPWGEDGSYKS